MKNILITGAHGFVGTNLSCYLTKEDGISLSSLSTAKKTTSAYSECYSWDDLDRIDWNSIDTIIHLAGKAHDTKSNLDSKVYFEINTELTKKVFNYFIHSNVRKFIFFSSVKAAADRVIGDYLAEDVIPAPEGAYGESKIKAEEYLMDYIEHHKAPDKLVYILRPCMIHGPGNKGNLNLLYKIISKGIPWPLGKFHNRRSYMSIDNLCFIIFRLIKEDIDSGIYHLADDEVISTNRLIEMIADSMGYPKRIWYFDTSLVRWIARIGDKIHLPLNSERLQKLTENYVVSNVKIKNALNIDKLPYTAEGGFEKTLQSFKNYH